jgi:aminopeptidase
VDVVYRDEALELIRFQSAPRHSFGEFSGYLAEGALKHVQNGGAYLSITSANPGLLKDQDPELIALAEKTRTQHMKPVSELLRRNAFNWCIAGYPSPAWAEKVFPNLAAEARIEKLWTALFHVTRADQADPVAAWKAHIADLTVRKTTLTGKQYAALHLTGPGTDLTIGLAQGHRWMGGSVGSTLGMDFIPNLPTEEVFSLPDRNHIEGVVTATKPLSYAGSLIDGFSLTFEHGRVVKAQAGQGEASLLKLLDTDEGARSLGEIALVPHRSPVSDTGILFYNTLLDENAACHIALGNGLNFCLEGGETLSQEDYLARGGNASLIHVDFMIGSDQVDIDGVTAAGEREPVMRKGAWAF